MFKENISHNFITIFYTGKDLKLNKNTHQPKFFFADLLHVDLSQFNPAINKANNFNQQRLIDKCYLPRWVHDRVDKVFADHERNSRIETDFNLTRSIAPERKQRLQNRRRVVPAW